MEELRDFSRPLSEDSVILISVIKNEHLLLEYFIKHHAAIGITHFIFIDNNSTDGTLDYLLTADYNIRLFSTKESYANNNMGMKWVNEILNKYCKDRWCVVLDGDEILHVENIRTLISEMENADNNVCRFYLLDMYSKTSDILYIRGEPFTNHSSFYDRESPNNKSFNHGVRRRTMGVAALLQKFPVFKYTFYCHGVLGCGSHNIAVKSNNHNCIRYHSKTEIILHFKFIKPNLKEVFKLQVEAGQHWNNCSEYRRYAAAKNYEFYDPKYSLCIHDTKPVFAFTASVPLPKNSS